MALTYSSDIQNQVANILTGGAYSTLSAEQKNLIDGTWTVGALTIANGVAYAAFTQISQIGQWYNLTDQTAPTVFDQWLVFRMVRLAALQLRPDVERYAHYVEAEQLAEMSAIDAFSRNAITYAPGSTPESSTLTLQNLRYHVMLRCARMARWETVGGTRVLKPRLWIGPEEVDSVVNKVVVHLWNKADWPFKRRTAMLVVTPYAVTASRYTNSTKTIYATVSIPYTGGNGTAYVVGETVTESATGATGSVVSVIATSSTAGTLVLLPLTATVVTGGQTLTGAGGAVATGGTKTSYLSSTIAAGATVTIASGTGIVACERIAVSALADSIVLGAAPLGVTGNLATGDIVLTVVSAAIDGLVSETFDGFATRELFYTDGSQKLVWGDGDQISRLRSYPPMSGRPATFRYQQNSGVNTFEFSHTPDTTYYAGCEVYVQGPTLPAAVSTTTEFARFPAKFQPLIRDWTFAEVMAQHGDYSLLKKIEGDIDNLLPTFADLGRMDDTQGTRDVYRDIEAVSGDNACLGGAM